MKKRARAATDCQPFVIQADSLDTAVFHRWENIKEIGRDDWIRTSDPLTPSQVRYQAAPHPEILYGRQNQTDHSKNFGLAEAQRAKADRSSSVLLFLLLRGLRGLRVLRDLRRLLRRTRRRGHVEQAARLGNVG